MKNFRRNLLSYFTECTDYELSFLFQTSPNLIEVIKEFIRKKDWVSVADAKQGQNTCSLKTIDELAEYHEAVATMPKDEFHNKE